MLPLVYNIECTSFRNREKLLLLSISSYGALFNISDLPNFVHKIVYDNVFIDWSIIIKYKHFSTAECYDAI